MKRAVSIVKYLTACLNAITEGLEITSNKWPDNNPFSKPVADKVPNANKDVPVHTPIHADQQI